MGKEMKQMLWISESSALENSSAQCCYSRGICQVSCALAREPSILEVRMLFNIFGCCSLTNGFCRITSGLKKELGHASANTAVLPVKDVRLDQWWECPQHICARD